MLAETGAGFTSGGAAHLLLKAMRVVYIGLGANLASSAGPPEATLACAAERLGALGRVAARSRLYSTAPVGFADQPRFLNAAVKLETALEPGALLDALMGIEAGFGRDRSGGLKNGPRTLDLDILLIEGEAVDEPGLVVPHPRLAERAFALAPLCEIGAGARDPASGATMTEWLERLFAERPEERGAVVGIESNLW